MPESRITHIVAKMPHIHTVAKMSHGCGWGRDRKNPGISEKSPLDKKNLSLDTKNTIGQEKFLLYEYVCWTSKKGIGQMWKKIVEMKQEGFIRDALCVAIIFVALLNWHVPVLYFWPHLGH